MAPSSVVESLVSHLDRNTMARRLPVDRPFERVRTLFFIERQKVEFVRIINKINRVEEDETVPPSSAEYDRNKGLHRHTGYIYRKEVIRKQLGEC